jgi:hypothetical protein
MPLLPAAVTAFSYEDIARRIHEKIDEKIAALTAEEPGLPERLAAEARQRALHSLGLADIHQELERLAAQQQELARRQRQAYRALLAVVRRVPLEEVEPALADGLPPEVAAAIARRQAVHEAELLAQDERGRHLLRLRRAQDHLQEALWLTSCPARLRQLWLKVLELLGEEPTDLERQALAADDPETEA